MTDIGNFLYTRSVNQSEVSRKTGISKARINQLCNNPNTQIKAAELYLIFLAVDADPGDEFMKMHKDLKLVDLSEEQDNEKDQEEEDVNPSNIN